MAKYFSQFPLTSYRLGDSAGIDTAVKITAGYRLQKSFKENTVIYYSYVIQDGETPEVIAYKVYDDIEKHWIILFMNDIIDPQYQWPLEQRNLIQYIREKYSANSAANQTGLEWAQANVKSYYKVEQLTYNNRTKTKQTIEIDEDQYNDLVTSTQSMTLKDGTSVVIETSKTTKSYYDYELENNESKRTIKILKPEFAAGLQQEFVNIFTAKALASA
jgi:hypothetical protein